MHTVCSESVCILQNCMFAAAALHRDRVHACCSYSMHAHMPNVMETVAHTLPTHLVVCRCALNHHSSLHPCCLGLFMRPQSGAAAKRNTKCHTCVTK